MDQDADRTQEVEQPTPTAIVGDWRGYPDAPFARAIRVFVRSPMFLMSLPIVALLTLLILPYPLVLLLIFAAAFLIFGALYVAYNSLSEEDVLNRQSAMLPVPHDLPEDTDVFRVLCQILQRRPLADPRVVEDLTHPYTLTGLDAGHLWEVNGRLYFRGIHSEFAIDGAFLEPQGHEPAFNLAGTDGGVQVRLTLLGQTVRSEYRQSLQSMIAHLAASRRWIKEPSVFPPLHAQRHLPESVQERFADSRYTEPIALPTPRITRLPTSYPPFERPDPLA